MSEGQSATTTATPAASEGVSSEAIETPVEATSAPEQAEPRHKLTIDGEEVELPLSEVLALAQKGKGAEKRFREAAEQRKHVEALVRRLPEDPVSALVAIVGDKSQAARTVTASLMRDPEVRAVFEREFYEQLKYESLPDDERKSLDRQRELEAKARKADEYERAEEERASREAKERFVQHFTQEFPQHLEAVGLPANRRTMARMAYYAERALETKERGVTMRTIAERVRDDLHEDVRTLAGSLEGDPLVQLLGPAAAKLQKAAVAKLTPRAPQPERQPGKGKAPPAREPVVERKRMSTSQFFKRIRGEG